MNLLLDFVRMKQRTGELGWLGPPEGLACAVLTPRFRTSRHVLLVLAPRRSADPALFAKVPRRAEDRASVSREARNLRAWHQFRPAARAAVPQLVAFEEFRGYPLLLETALVGRALDPTSVRRNPAACCELVLRWLLEMRRDSEESGSWKGWHQALIEAPLADFARQAGAQEQEFVEQTVRLAERHRDQVVQPVFEHGDLCHPNVMLLDGGQLGVLDWELAEPRGLPACDLFFFLAYMAAAKAKSGRVDDQVRSFHEAFFGPASWAAPIVAEYAEQMMLSKEALSLLFVACWARYTARLALRATLEIEGCDDSLGWLRSTRYYAFWRHSLDHFDALTWNHRAA